jgi:hypothetical protein
VLRNQLQMLTTLIYEHRDVTAIIREDTPATLSICSEQSRSRVVTCSQKQTLGFYGISASTVRVALSAGHRAIFAFKLSSKFGKSDSDHSFHLEQLVASGLCWGTNTSSEVQAFPRNCLPKGVLATSANGFTHGRLKAPQASVSLSVSIGAVRLPNDELNMATCVPTIDPSSHVSVGRYEDATTIGVRIAK